MANFQLLKVLDFEDARELNSLPEDVGNLLHLRYQSLRKKNVKVLPKSIVRLVYLLTLDLKYSLVDELPIEIKSLHKLRHLLASNRTQRDDGVKTHEGFGCLKDLQNLKSVELANDHHGAGRLVKELTMLRQLRKLDIRNLKHEDGKDLCNAVANLRHLEYLYLRANSDDILDLHVSSPFDSLQHLTLDGRLEKFPDWISKLQNVVRILLKGSMLTEDPLKFLATRPSLLKLVLDNAYVGKVLHFEGGGFPKLQKLYVDIGMK